MTSAVLHSVYHILNNEKPELIKFVQEWAKNTGVRLEETENGNRDTEEDKIHFMIELVQYLKTRKESFASDLTHSQEIVEALGYDRAVISELFLLVYTDSENDPDINSVKFKVQQYKL